MEGLSHPGLFFFPLSSHLVPAAWTLSPLGEGFWKRETSDFEF